MRDAIVRGAAVLALAAATLAPALSLACPNCKEAVARESVETAGGYNRSVLFMLGLVAVLGGSLAGLVAYVVRSESGGAVPPLPAGSPRSPERRRD